MNKASVFVATFAIAAVAMFSGYHVGSSKAAPVSPSEQIAAPPKVINYEDYLELTHLPRSRYTTLTWSLTATQMSTRQLRKCWI